MSALARLASLRQQLQTAAGPGSTEPNCSLSAESAEEIVVVSWSAYPPAELDPEEQAALDAIGTEIGRPVRMHSWSEHVQPMLAGSDQLSEEETAAAKAEVRAVLGKAVAWFGAPLRWWDEVKALVREECAGAEWPPSLRWIHNTFTGVDMIAAAEPPSSVIVTNMRGRFDVTIAEFVLAWMLMACKQMATLLKQHAEANWPSLPRVWADGGTTLLRGKTVAIIGLGSIGSAMAEMYSLMGMKVLGLRRTATPGQTPPPFVDTLYPLSDLHTVLGLADFVVLAMPQTPQTEGMIGAVCTARRAQPRCVRRVHRFPDAALLVHIIARRLSWLRCSLMLHS
jgi:phosphoglycerate dehydrogenase-like enzyme